MALATFDDDVSNAGYWLDPASDEFNELRIYAINCLRGRELSALEIWKIENVNNFLAFEKRSTNLLVLPCWSREPVDDVANDLQSICRRGYDLLSEPCVNGISFFTGSFDASVTEASDYESFVYIYSDVCVGKAFPAVDKTTEVPTGYDSLYLLNTSAGNDTTGNSPFSTQNTQSSTSIGQSNSGVYRHEYRITETELIRPRYVFRFSLAEKGKLRGTISRASATDPDPYLFFDPILYRPLTLRDKLSSGFNSSQRLLTIDDAFNQAITEAKIVDPVTIGRKQWIDQQLDILDDKAREVNLNYADVHEEINKCAARATEQLQLITKEKLGMISSVEIELRRQLEQFKWVESLRQMHIKKLVESLQDDRIGQAERSVGKVEFLRCSRSYIQYTNSLSRAKFLELQMLPPISSDICLHADLNVYLGNKQDSLASLSTSQVQDGLFNDARGYLAMSQQHNHFGASSRPSNELLSSSLQTLLTHKHSRIQETLSVALNDRKYPLPISLSGHIVSGSTFSSSIAQHVNVNAVDFGGRSTQSSAFVDPRLLFSSKLNSIVMDGDRAEPPVAIVDNSATTQSVTTRPLPSREPAVLNEAFDLENMEMNRNDDEKVISTEQLRAIASKYRQHSLISIADRKFKLFQVKNVLGFQSSIDVISQTSSILNPSDAHVLYFNLPFFSTPPSCRLLFSTKYNKRTLDDVLMKTIPHKGASLIVMRSSEMICGAYLSHPLALTGSWTGSPACFLFNLSLDIKFPYHARVPPPSASGGSVAFVVDREKLTFGNGDLIINETISTGTSTLEGCYGVGLPVNSVEAGSIFGGHPKFVIDVLEIWAIIA